MTTSSVMPAQAGIHAQARRSRMGPRVRGDDGAGTPHPTASSSTRTFTLLPLTLPAFSRAAACCAMLRSTAM